MLFNLLRDLLCGLSHTIDFFWCLDMQSDLGLWFIPWGWCRTYQIYLINRLSSPICSQIYNYLWIWRLFVDLNIVKQIRVCDIVTDLIYMLYVS